MKYLWLVAVAALSASIWVPHAHATEYTFDFDAPITGGGGPFDITGVLNTSDTLDSKGGYDVTSFSGTVTEGSLATSYPIILETNPNPPNVATSVDGYYYFDNVLYPTAPLLDDDGLVLTANGDSYNIYWDGSKYGLSTDAYYDLNSELSGTLTLTYVPEPASMALLGTALFGFGLFCRRRRRAV